MKRHSMLLIYILLACPIGYWISTILRASLGFTGWGMAFKFPSILVTYVSGLLVGLIGASTLIGLGDKLLISRWPRFVLAFVGLVILIALPSVGNPENLAALPNNIGRELLHALAANIIAVGVTALFAPERISWSHKDNEQVASRGA